MIRKLLAFLGELILHTHNDDRKDTNLKLFSRRTTDSIVGPLQKIVAKLDAHADHQLNLRADKERRAEHLKLQAGGHDAEAARALAARDKIAGLIG